MNRREFIKLAAALPAATMALKTTAGYGESGGSKVNMKHLVVYENELFYSAFPSVVLKPDGELLVAFRRAPDRRAVGQPGVLHTHPNSYLVLVRSEDNGATWTNEPELILAHPLGGSQDPCMVQLKDGTIVCTSYGWSLIDEKIAETKTDSLRHKGFVFLGGYIVRSFDGGDIWSDPIVPPPVPGNVSKDLFGNPAPAYNRGAMCQGDDGRLYWVVVGHTRVSPRLSSTHLMISSDKGETWEYSCPVAEDDKASFNETSLYQTPGGDFVAFMRTANFDDHTVVARSTDGGQSFQPWEDTGFQGHPHHIIRLPDDRAFLIYGYRHEPYGIRARILNPECTDFATAEEIIIRDDGGSRDIGYPWATLLPDGRVLAVYYFNKGEGVRHIAGTILELA